MIYQEDIMLYFDGVAQMLREENIPLFNNIIFDYPGFPPRVENEIIESDDENTSEED